jgi:DNA-binding SARP family transcriptional activator
MNGVTLCTFGDVRLIHGSTEIRLPSKCAAMLALLCASRNSTMKRSDATMLLWSSDSDRAARHSLNQAVYTIKRLLGHTFIQSSPTNIQLSAELTADFTQLEEAIDLGDLGVVRRIANGDFFGGAAFDDCEFSHWRERKAASIETKLLGLYEKLLRNATARQDANAVEALACEAVERFSYSSAFRIDLIKSRLRQRKVTEARAAYEEMTALLDVKTSSDGLPTWDQLVHAARVPKVPHRVGRPPFIGRLQELQTAKTLWDRACDGSGSLLFVSGKPGIGKTFLCDEYAVALSGGRQFRASGYQTAESVGFSLVTDLLQHPIQADELESLSPVLRLALQHVAPHLTIGANGADWPHLGHEAGERRVFEAVTNLLITISKRCPVRLILDDLQWADSASLTWLNYFVRGIRDERVLVIAAFRSDRQMRLPITDCSSHIVLTEFSRSEVASFLETVTSADSDPRTVERVYELTNGHPLYTKLLASRLADGLHNLDIAEISESVGRLSSIDRRIVGLLCVIGVPVSLEEIGSICGIKGTDVAARVESMPELCVLRDDGTAALAHDLIRKSVYGRLPTTVRESLHSRVARHFEKDPEMVGLAAEHWARTGDRIRTSRTALRAAKDSERKHAAVAAGHFYEMAIQALDDPMRRRQIEERLANLRFSTGQFEAALSLAHRLAMNSVDEAAALDWKWKYLACRLALRSTDTNELLMEAADLEKSADRIKHPEAVYQACFIQAQIECRRIGDHALPRLTKRLRALSLEYPRTRVGTMAIRFLASHEAATNCVTASLKDARTATDWATELGQAELVILSLRTLAWTEYASGDLLNARRTLNRANATIEQTGAVLYRSNVSSLLIAVLIELDARKEALEQLDLMEKAASIYDPSDYVISIANKALLFYHYNEYLGAIHAANQMIRESSGQFWSELTVRGVRGLSWLELGKIGDAIAEANGLQRALSSPGVIAGDISYPITLIARVAVLTNSEAQVEPFVRAKVAQYSDGDHICRQRLRLALAELLARNAPPEALSLAEDVRFDAESRHLRALFDQAAATTRRIRRNVTSWRRP